ncbi:MAG: formylglycine-generating enzyme family protein [Candidatus Methanospirareceae archaeon]
MADIEIKRGYEVLPDNNVRFGIRVINNSDSAISDVEVILDYSESLFSLEDSKVWKLGTIPPAAPRTAKFILKPLGCIHKEEIGAIVLYRDHQWKRHTREMHPKEVHCVCPFLKEKSITRTQFLTLLDSGYFEERGINFEGITVDKVVDFLYHTCKNRLYRVDEFPTENGTILYLAGDALGEKAYYLLTAVVKEYDSVTQVLLRANSDKRHGLNGFLNEIVDNLCHLVLSAEAREIGIIKKEQVINIIDSVVQRTTFAGGEGAASVNIKESVVQHTEIKEDAEKRRQETEERRAREEAERKERARVRQEEERLQREEEERKTREEYEKREREEQEKLRREEEERQRKEQEERKRIRREEEEKKGRERKAKAEQEKKAREEAERQKREEEKAAEGEEKRCRREEGERKAREAAEQREKAKTAREEERLRRERSERAAKGQGISQKTVMAVVLALGVLLIGFWMLTPGSTDAPPPSETVPLSTRTATPDASRDSEVSQAVSQTPTPAADQEETVTNSIGMEFVLIPAGEFKMGSPSDEGDRYSNEGPVHHVTIEKAFYLGRYEVTQEEWQEVMGNNPSYFEGDNLPVEMVSWDDVQEFIKKLNKKEGTDKYRLPSEAEWEYACRAGTTTRYSFGDSESKLGDYAWYDGNSGSKTHPVGKKKPNSYGLYDMHGNVWERVQDKYHSDYDSAPTDGSAWESRDGAYRVFRGGCWNFLARCCRSSARSYYGPSDRYYRVGFRLLEET